MRIYTSYFSNPVKLNKDTTMYVSIARYKPDWFDGPEYTKLAPPAELLSYYKSNIKNPDVNAEDLYKHYIKYYCEKTLHNLEQYDVVKDLQQMASNRGKEDIVLLCYEKYGDFCHRHIVSQWLNLEDYECCELTAEEIKRI